MDLTPEIHTEIQQQIQLKVIHDAIKKMTSNEYSPFRSASSKLKNKRPGILSFPLLRLQENTSYFLYVQFDLVLKS